MIQFNLLILKNIQLSHSVQIEVNGINELEIVSILHFMTIKSHQLITSFRAY